MRLRRWIIGATVVLAASSVLAIVQAVVSRADLTDELERRCGARVRLQVDPAIATAAGHVATIPR